MMIKLFFLTSFITVSLFSSVSNINKDINNNKKILIGVSKSKTNINKNIGTLIKKIKKEERNYNKIVNTLESTSTKLLLNKLKLSNSREELKSLKVKSIDLNSKKDEIEKNVINNIIDKYSMSMGIKQANKESLGSIIDKEVYTLVFQNAKDEVFNLNIDYLKVNKQVRDNEDKIIKLNKFIENQKNVKEGFLKKEEEQSIILESLKNKHKAYQKHLKTIIGKQNKLTDLLGNLKILKSKEIKKARDKAKRAELKRKKELERKRKQALISKATSKISEKKIRFSSKKKLDDDIDIEVRKIGSSTKGIKISKYKGAKTIAPLKSYRVVKKFGKYYDKVYKMELFNESISLKTKKPNAKVFSVFKGEIVYAKQNSGLLENVVIVKHRGNLHTIYSHLDKISPTLKVGKWIPKGYVVGRVNDTLLFQATKNNKYIDPIKLFRKR